MKVAAVRHKVAVSWVKAKSADLGNYRVLLSQYLMDICIPTEAVLCKDMKCDNAMHSIDLNR